MIEPSPSLSTVFPLKLLFFITTCAEVSSILIAPPLLYASLSINFEFSITDNPLLFMCIAPPSVFALFFVKLQLLILKSPFE